MNPGTVTIGTPSQYTPGQVAGGNVPLGPGEAPGQGHVTIGPGGVNYDANAQRAAANDASTQALLASISRIPGPYIPPTAPTLDLNSIRAGAASEASNAVNPLYTKYLNTYLQNEAAGIAAQKAQNTSTIGNLQGQLANTLAGTQNTRTATQQNTEAGLADIAAQQQNYLRTQGTNFENQRQGMLNTEGTLAGSGLGQQKDIQSQIAQQNTEAAQQQQYKYSAQQKNLFENQTFAQLANSDELARLKETEGENTTNFNLKDYLNQAADGEANFQKENEVQKQQALQAATSSAFKSRLLAALEPYKGNAGVYGAGLQQYGGLSWTHK